MVEEAHAGAQEEVNRQRSAVAQADQRLQGRNHQPRPRATPADHRAAATA